MRDKIEFTFVDETGLCHKHYIGYDYSKAGSCCGIQVLADIFIAEWRHPDGIDDEDEGWFSTLSYRNISKELNLAETSSLSGFSIGNSDLRSSKF